LGNGRTTRVLACCDVVGAQPRAVVAWTGARLKNGLRKFFVATWWAIFRRAAKLQLGRILAA
jgi:hypothetical protein